jgi:hypothetical protein
MKYFRKLKTVIIIAIVAVIVCSCDRDKVFEREQYKNVFALLSDDDGFNVFAEEFYLGSNIDDEGFVSAVCGGSLPTGKDINITMVEDEDLLLAYNTSNFELDESKYAQLLPRSNYDIANLNITIPAGERTGLMNIVIRPNGLSPDSVYFIPLRANKFTEYELNPEKSDVLYRVMIKNYYATQKTATLYDFRGKFDGVNIRMEKQVFPINRNTARIVAGNIYLDPKEPTVELINSASILLNVDFENKVSIYPYKSPEQGGITVTQIDDDPEYPNIFRIDDDGYNTYKTFLLRYDYVYQGVTHSMQEELRLEFTKTNEFF